MREVAQRRQQLEVEHEQARLSLQEKQEEVRRLQQVGAGGREGWEAAGALTCPLIQAAFTEHPLSAMFCARHWAAVVGKEQVPDQSTNKQMLE